MKKIFTLSALALALSACGDDPLSDKSGIANAGATLEINGVAKTGETLTAILVDGDGYDADAVAYRWMVDGQKVSSTSRSYLLTDAVIGKKVSVTVAYRDNNLNSELLISPATAKVLGPELGQVVITGEMQPEVELIATVLDGNGLGDGEIIYTWYADGVAIDADAVGDVANTYLLTEADLGKVITVSADYIDAHDYVESVQSVAGDAVAAFIAPREPYDAGEQAAKIEDTLTSDTGELRYKFDEPATKGKLFVAVMYEIGQQETATINLFDESHSDSSVIAQLRLDEGKLELRDGIDNATPISLDGFSPGQWVEIELSWDTSSTTDAGTYNVTINGEDALKNPFTAYNTEPGVAVTAASVKIGSDTKTTNKALWVDGFSIYPGVEDEEEPIFSEDFEGYDLETSLDEDINSDSPFNSSSSEVDVQTAPTIIDPNFEGRGQYVAINDTLTDDNGEIRFHGGEANGGASADMLQEGLLKVSFLKMADSIGSDGNKKDAYITLYGSGGSNATAILDLRIHSLYPWFEDESFEGKYDGTGEFEVRNSTALALGDLISEDQLLDKYSDASDFDSYTGNFKRGVAYNLDEWVDVEISWDSTSEEKYTKVSIKINGVPYSGFTTSAAENGGDEPDVDGVRHIAMRFSDGSRTLEDKYFLVDDIELYNNQLGVGDPIFADNFETYTVGDPIIGDDTGVTNASTPDGITFYNKATVDATVAVDDEDGELSFGE